LARGDFLAVDNTPAVVVADRMKQEFLARLLVLSLALGAGGAALASRFWDNSGVIEVHAAMPDKGGWLTSDIQAQVGEPLHLLLVSDDVIHSFALGQSDFEPVDVLPGKPAEVILTFDEPRTYSFYCTRWCGADHWRMRGTITVQGNQAVDPQAPGPPLYLQMEIDLDAPREIQDLGLDRPPSAPRGADLEVALPAKLLTQEYYRTHTPYQAWEELNSEPAASNLNTSQIWDLVAWAWELNTNPPDLAEGEALYQRDCAACHGVEGAGDGVFGAGSSFGTGSPHEASPDGQFLETPTNFQNLDHMLSISPALLQGKILRGGMGTGMPSWGLIYTDDQTWALVDYLWTYPFDFSVEE
jgi:mono/diheme cytochrome c family protein